MTTNNDTINTVIEGRRVIIDEHRYVELTALCDRDGQPAGLFCFHNSRAPDDDQPIDTRVILSMAAINAIIDLCCAPAEDSQSVPCLMDVALWPGVRIIKDKENADAAE